MKRRLHPITVFLFGMIAGSILMWFIVDLPYQREVRNIVHDLEERNAALSRLCGPLVNMPCNEGETGAQCQERLGDAYEVIYDPKTGKKVAEVKP